MRSFLSLSLVAGTLLAAFAQSADAQVISVNFLGNNNASTVTGSAGAISASNWNNATGNPGGPLALVDDSGAATGATVSWTGGGTWSTNNAVGVTQNGNLMTGYLDNFGGGTITVTGLPTSFTNNGYDVYVYHASDSAGVQGYTANDSSISATAFGRQAGANGTNYPLAGPDGFLISTDPADAMGATTASNAILLQGLTGASFTITGINGAGFADGRARPNGFQIVALESVPEPASMAVWLMVGMAISGCGYLRLRRNRK